LNGLARQSKRASCGISRAVVFESTRNRTAKGSWDAKRTRLAASRPCCGETPRISRSTGSWASANENACAPSVRFETANSRPRISARVSLTTSDSSMIKIRFIHLSAAVGCGRTHRLAHRNVDEKRRALADRAFHGDKAAVLLHDLMRHRQPQTTALIFAGKKWIKNMLQVCFGDSDTCVAHLDLNKLAGRLGPMPGDGTSRNTYRSTLLHGLYRVEN